MITTYQNREQSLIQCQLIDLIRANYGERAEQSSKWTDELEVFYGEHNADNSFIVYIHMKNKKFCTKDVKPEKERRRSCNSNIYKSFKDILIIPLLLICVLLTTASCGSEAKYRNNIDTINGKVVSIADGDTFTLLTYDKKQEKIRLYGIDSPEKKQAFGFVAKQRLGEMIFAKQVRVHFKTYDRWKRIVGVVFCENKNINESMLECGLAWHFLKYDGNQKWTAIEENAKQRKIGLWADAHPTPPWEWRKSN